MKRISVDEVRAAFKKIGRKPRRGVWGGKVYACGFGAVRLAAGASPRSLDGFSREYRDGYASGWDCPTCSAFGTAEYRAGHADGAAAAKAMNL